MMTRETVQHKLAEDTRKLRALGRRLDRKIELHGKKARRYKGLRHDEELVLQSLAGEPGAYCERLVEEHDTRLGRLKSAQQLCAKKTRTFWQQRADVTRELAACKAALALLGTHRGFMRFVMRCATWLL